MGAPAERRPGHDRDTTYELVYRQHHDHLVRLARRWLFDDGAEHVAQDVLLGHWQRPERFDPQRGSLRAFLRVSCRSRAIDVARSEDARRRRDTAYEALPKRPTVEGTDTDREEVVAALHRLPDTQRQAIALAFYGDLTYREVATRLGLPEGTVKTRIRTGLVTLRTHLPAPVPAALPI